MVLPRVQQDIRNARAREKRRLLKVNNNIQKVEPEEPKALNEIIEEPLEEPKEESTEPSEEPIEEPIEEPEPELFILSKAEITANKRRASLAFARSQIKPRGFYTEIIKKKDIEIMKLQEVNKTLFEMATLKIKPDIPDKDIPDYIFTEDIKQKQKQPQQQLIPQIPPDTMDYLANQTYAQKLQGQFEQNVHKNLITNTFG